MIDSSETSGGGGEKLSAQDELVGTYFEQRFEILELLGKGSSGSTYRANEAILQRQVAIKIMHSFLAASNPKAAERFRQELVTSTILSHPNIVNVYSCGTTANGQLYMVMELLQGENLEEMIARNGPLKLPLAIDLFLQFADAIYFAHEKGIVHRDLKPSNIVITNANAASPRAVIIDFGIAKCIDQSAEQNSTQTGVMLGSCAYMSPEQCSNKSVDRRSDIYSLGCVMYECLVGKALFQGESHLDIMYKQINQSVDELDLAKLLPAAIAKIIQKCLEKEPAKRYQNVSELRKDLVACTALNDSNNEKGGATSRKQSPFIKLFSIGAIICILLAFIAAVNYFHSQTKLHSNEMANQFLKKTHAPSPETVKIPITEDGVRTLRALYQLEPNAETKMIVIYRRWLQEYDHSPKVTLEGRLWIYRDYFRTLNETGQVEEAKKIAALLLKYGATNLDRCNITILESKCLCDAGKFNDALKTSDSAIKQNETEMFSSKDSVIAMTRLYESKGAVYCQLKQFNEAARAYEKSMEIQKTLCERMGFPGNAPGLLHCCNYLAFCLAKGGRIAEISTYVDLCLLASKRDPKAHQSDGTVFASIARSLASADASTESRQYFEKAIQAYKKDNDELQVKQVRTEMLSLGK